MELPEEPKLEFPLLSDPNNKICEHCCGAMLWKEETTSFCSTGEYAVDNLQFTLCRLKCRNFSTRSFVHHKSAQQVKQFLFSFTALLEPALPVVPRNRVGKCIHSHVTLIRGDPALRPYSAQDTNRWVIHCYFSLLLLVGPRAPG